MTHERHTPVIPARHVTAATAQPGDRVAVNIDQGTYPFEITDTERDEDQVRLHLRELCTTTPRTGVVHIDPDQVLAALAAHFGVCAHCGRLSPCPDELSERRLEKLWHDGGAPTPVLVGDNVATPTPAGH